MYFHLVAFPSTTTTLVWYVQFLSKKLKSHASIIAYLSAVKTLHTLLGFSTRGFRGILLKLTLQGLRRMNTHVPRRARPITPTLLKKVYFQLNHNNPKDAVFWLTCIMAFFLLFRKSNLVPNTKDGFNGRKQLKVADCTIINNRLVVGIRWAKNQQFSRELLTFPLPSLGDSVLCPLRAFKKVLSLFKHEPQQHLFCLPSGDSLTYRYFQEQLKEILANLGVPNADEYTSHSYRRGGTTFLFLCGVPLEIRKLLGNWRSQCYLTYLEFPLETRTAACKLMKFRIMALERNGGL